MAEESTTPDLVELVRPSVDPINVGDLDAMARQLRGDGDSAGGNPRPRQRVSFAVIRQGGRPSGSSAYAHMRFAAVAVWTDGLAVPVTNYTDIDEARAAAERLAESRE